MFGPKDREIVWLSDGSVESLLLKWSDREVFDCSYFNIVEQLRQLLEETSNVLNLLVVNEGSETKSHPTS